MGVYGGGRMKIKIAVGWPDPVDVVWDDEATPETIGGIVDACLELPKTKILIWRSDTGQEGEDQS
jgi:hypothetical protein